MLNSFIVKEIQKITACQFTKSFDGDINWSYKTDTIVQYYNHYKKVMSYWNKDYASSIYTIKYENLISDSELKIRELLDFYDVEFEQNCVEFYNNKRPIKTVSINQARQLFTKVQ